MASPSQHKMSLEVEEKFQLSDSTSLESRLKELGFVPSAEVSFVDWYFDTERNQLTLQDCWLRFREKAGEKGKWELKRGRSSHHSSSTVYEETEGKEAVSIAVSMLPTDTIVEKRTSNVETYDGFAVPKFTGYENGIPFQPFCRLETRRSSWKVNPNELNNVHFGLLVDLDETDTGHAVGEVEMVVEDEDGVADAKRRVRDLVIKLTEGDRRQDSPTEGKLEHFLRTRRPQHYAACVKCGILTDPIKDMQQESKQQT
eukprot:scaffold1561_cov129-Cylindrotheca_fusiformis.AAC.39